MAHAVGSVAAFQCLNGRVVRYKRIWPQITVERLQDELQDVTQYFLLFHPQGDTA
jgi:hypothetical protein